MTPERRRADAQSGGRILIGLLVTWSSGDEHSVALGMKVQVHRRESLQMDDRAEESGRECWEPLEENEGDEGGGRVDASKVWGGGDQQEEEGKVCGHNKETD